MPETSSPLSSQTMPYNIERYIGRILLGDSCMLGNYEIRALIASYLRLVKNQESNDYSLLRPQGSRFHRGLQKLRKEDAEVDNYVSDLLAEREIQDEKFAGLFTLNAEWSAEQAKEEYIIDKVLSMINAGIPIGSYRTFEEMEEEFGFNMGRTSTYARPASPPSGHPSVHFLTDNHGIAFVADVLGLNGNDEDTETEIEDGDEEEDGEEGGEAGFELFFGPPRFRRVGAGALEVGGGFTTRIYSDREMLETWEQRLASLGDLEDPFEEVENGIVINPTANNTSDLPGLIPDDNADDGSDAIARELAAIRIIEQEQVALYDHIVDLNQQLAELEDDDSGGSGDMSSVDTEDGDIQGGQLIDGQ